MATDVIMPALGVAQEKGTLINWFKAEGQSVTKGEPLMEVETDKATVEIEAPASGILANVTATPGDEVPVGNRIALILAPGENVERAQPSHPITARLEAAQPTSPTAKSAPAPQTQAPRSGTIPASPAARRIAREKGVDLSTLRGTGPQGRFWPKMSPVPQRAKRALATDRRRSKKPSSSHRCVASLANAWRRANKTHRISI